MLLYAVLATDQSSITGLNVLKERVGLLDKHFLFLQDEGKPPEGSVCIFKSEGAFCSRSHGPEDKTTGKRPKRALQMIIPPEDPALRESFLAKCGHEIPVWAKDAWILIAVNAHPGTANLLEAMRNMHRSCKEQQRQRRRTSTPAASKSEEQQST